MPCLLFCHLRGHTQAMGKAYTQHNMFFLFAFFSNHIFPFIAVCELGYM